ncbi:SH3 domain-containing protein 1-like [Lycium barbarum]|uniref:SH3 domain-containing protein 1-like n=1 Tax=Lycium barbarum TaxID=112863 RepID=UPI00293EF2B3|nr:SH3 domain-containing protein 1-like [Lycium barbarum]
MVFQEDRLVNDDDKASMTYKCMAEMQYMIMDPKVQLRADLEINNSSAERGKEEWRGTSLSGEQGEWGAEKEEGKEEVGGAAARATEVIRRQSKFREASSESLAKLKNAETRLSELKSSVLILGKEATDAMLSVEEEQQQITFQKLRTMVDAERSYHQNVVSILEKLHSEMLEEEQLNESSPQSSNSPRVLHDTTSNGTEHPEAEDKCYIPYF